MKHKIKCLLTAVILAGMATAGMGQSNLYVATNGTDNSDAGRGQSWSLPYATISNGIAHASTAGDTVWASNGTYVLSAQLSLANAITVSSWSVNAADTIIDGGYSARTGRCVYISAAATLNGFTISNGAVSGDGGGIYLNNASCVVTNCIITRNRTTGGDGRGGGLFLNPGGTVTACVISHNVSTPSSWPYGGGGLYCNTYGSVVNCRFISNAVHGVNSVGGGMQIWSPTAAFIVSNCAFDGNIVGYLGGGIACQGSFCQIVDCTVSNNMATNGTGGGLYLGPGGTVSNCTIRGNGSSGNGGGVDLASLLINCDISSNASSGKGGGLWIRDAGLAQSCTITGNVAYSSGGIYFTGSGKTRCSLVAGNVATGGVYDSAGGVGFDTGVGKLENCTIVSNQGYYGGVYIGTYGQVENTIIYLNYGTYSNVSAAATGYFTNCCVAPTNGLSGSGNIALNPQFIDTNNANYRLAKGSPGINTGLNQDWMANGVDLDGRMRRRYGTVDMGAYEAIYNAFIFTGY